MKSLFKNLLLLTSVFSLALLFSCGDEDPEGPGAAPSLTVTATVNGTATTDSPIELVVGDSLGFSVDITAEEGFNTLNVTYSVDGAADATFQTINRVDLGVDVGTSLVEGILLSTIIESDLVGSNIVFTFEAVDETEPGQTSTATVEVNVSSPEAKVQTAVIIFAPSADSLTNTFYSINNNETYSIYDINTTSEPLSADIDLGYFYGAEANLVSPSDYASLTGVYVEEIGAWGTKNSTSMVLLTDVEVTEISTVADVEAELEGVDFNSQGETSIEGLAAGEVYAFETSGGLTGLVRVISILEGSQVGADPNNPEVTGNVELEFIIAAAAE